METYFASAERASDAEISHDIQVASASPVVTALLKTTIGLLAILNQHRQVLMVNDSFMKTLGVDEPGRALGLRPGEVLDCVHAFELPGGCGTSRYCSTCGAAIAMVASLASEQPEERRCTIAVEKEGRRNDICLSVRSCVFKFEDRIFILLFLQDITASERWAVLDRLFLHDMNNLITGLVGTAEILRDEPKHEPLGGEGVELANEIYQLSQRLAHEVAMQAVLLQDGLPSAPVAIKPAALADLVDEARKLFANHPVAAGKTFVIPESIPSLKINTNASLALRVLENMIQNALEATEVGGEVKLLFQERSGRFCFGVWNQQPIPSDVARRIFERHFSTKNEPGRGLGTYAMKLFGEQFLNGAVYFTTSPAHGTTFWFCLPA